MPRVEDLTTHLPITEIRIDSIIVDERQRRTVDRIEEFSQSIREHGLFHPILVNGTTLVAGYRRMRAATLLGWEYIPCRNIENLSDVDRQWIELNENIQRQNLSMEEYCSAIKKIKEIGIAKFGARKPRSSIEKRKEERNVGFGVEDIAKITGKSIGHISDSIKLAEAIEKNPELKKEKRTTALRKLKKEKENKMREVLVQYTAETSPQPDLNFQCMNALSFLDTLPDRSVHCVIIDPPWNVNLDDRFANASWDEEPMFEVLEEVMKKLLRVVDYGAFIYTFFGIWHYNLIGSTIGKYFYLHRIPLIWSKGTSTETSYTYKRPGRSYEPIFFAQAAQPDLPRTLSEMFLDVIQMAPVHSTEKIHRAQKPQALMEFFIERSTTIGETVLDCFAGSGSALRAALALGRKAVGCEKDELTFDKANTFVRGVSSPANAGLLESLDSIIENAQREAN